MATTLKSDYWTTPLDCGHTPTALTFHGDDIPLTTGAATDRETGRTMCYRCADDAQRAGLAALRPGELFVAYLSGDGRYVTSWSGGKLARVTSHTVSRSGWHGSEVHYIRAVTPEGRRFYGCGGGEGMALTIRASKA